MLATQKLRADQLFEFKKSYQELSGLPIPIDFLTENVVYGYYDNSRLVGGFILSVKSPLRTIEVFARESNRPILYKKIEQTGTCTEICCFWLDYTYRKNNWINAYCWLKMAFYASVQYKSILILFGTNSKGLARMYAYPKNSLLFHVDRVLDKETFLFIARRHHFFVGVSAIIWSKLIHRQVPNGLETKSIIQTLI